MDFINLKRLCKLDINNNFLVLWRGAYSYEYTDDWENSMTHEKKSFTVN